MHQVGDLFELNVKLRCQKFKEYFLIKILDSYSNFLKSSGYLMYSHVYHSKILNYAHISCSRGFYGSQFTARYDVKL